MPEYMIYENPILSWNYDIISVAARSLNFQVNHMKRILLSEASIQKENAYRKLLKARLYLGAPASNPDTLVGKGHRLNEAINIPRNWTALLRVNVLDGVMPRDQREFFDITWSHFSEILFV